ncbi:MAG: GNAT family N-acetyltransferase [Bacteriovoracaceae bacterium]|nr:GNAT family N-acetyltransferase [Bacteriovoracaceae bacterium]
MVKINKLSSLENINQLKNDYVKQATAPLDGMWLTGFVPMAKHYEIYDQDRLLGYFCLNEEGYFLQYNIDQKYRSRSFEIFKSLMTLDTPRLGVIKGAFCSTAEPSFFSICLDNFSSYKVNAHMYQVNEQVTLDNDTIDLTKLNKDYLEDVVMFVHDAIEAPIDWLTGYLSNLISRNELYALIDDNKIIATGECRGFDIYQTQYADLGVIVSKNERSKGFATKVLKKLIAIAKEQGLIPICSTEAQNIGAQNAISKAGFFASNRIVQFSL